MKISWGRALKVGQASNEEIAEIQLEEFVKPADLMSRLNPHLPKGLEIIEAFLV
jgi:uncharacterized protein (DUF2344 family)